MTSEYKPTFGHRLEYLLVWWLFITANLLPRVWARFRGWYLGNLLYLALGRRRRIAKRNITERLGVTRRRAARIARRNFVKVAQNLLDFIRLPYFRGARRERWMSVDGLEHLATARRRGRGVILATAHTGPWELAAAYIHAHGHSGAALATRQHNQLVDGLLNRLRGKAGNRVLLVDEGARPVLRNLRANRVLYILADQDAGPDGRFIEFLGAPSSFHRGPAFFARRLGAPVCFGFSRREGAKLHAWISPPVAADPDADPEAEELRLTRLYAAALEAWIRRYPSDWYWMHRRWKTKPPHLTDDEC